MFLPIFFSVISNIFHIIEYRKNCQTCPICGAVASNTSKNVVLTVETGGLLKRDWCCRP